MGNRAEKQWWMKWETGDWLKDPCVSVLKPSTRGIWFDAICVMQEMDQCGQLEGTVVDLSRLCRCTSNEMRGALDDLKLRNAADVTERNSIVTLVNRRMRRKWTARKSSTIRKQRSRERLKQSGVTPHVTPHVTDRVIVRVKSHTCIDGSADDADAGIIGELKRAGVTGPNLSKLAATPGLTPLHIRITARRAKREAKKKDGGAALLVAMLSDGLPQLDLSPKTVTELVNEGVIRSIADHPVKPQSVKWNSHGIHIQVNGQDAVVVKPDELKASIFGIEELDLVKT